METVIHAIVYSLLVIFVLAGVIACVYLLMMRITKSKVPGRFIVVLPPQTTPSNVSALLCAARLRMGLMGDLVRSEVIALDAGLPEQVRTECVDLCRELDHVALVKPEDLLEKLRIDN